MTRRSWRAETWRSCWPVLAIVLAGVICWYGAAVWMNGPQVIERLSGVNPDWQWRDMVAAAWSMERPVIPVPHQILADFWSSLVDHDLDSPRNLIYHALVTLSATVLGFMLGIVLGVLIALGVVHNRVLDKGLLPWIIASQTVPVLAIAPMIVVVLGAMSVPPLVSKAVISMYLCFFPMAVGMVKGLRSPDRLQLDLMRTYSAGATSVMIKLRLPSSVPFLFASAKVAITTSLIGAIVGELPTGAQAGLGARLLQGSYFGQTIQIWSALLMASLLGVALVSMVSMAESGVARLMGARKP